ncbi:MAG: hypothetical protein L3K16_06655 [Thermoplasmata archaeon]|nr:hypothetical protein [Thermoplasmata archaeon]
MPFSPERKKAYDKGRRRSGRHIRRADRPFVGVDGEGWGKTYALLADSGGHSLTRPSGISSQEAFDWLSYLPERNGEANFVGFALGYDINHWLRDLSSAALYRLWREGRVRWEDWWIEWAPARWFHVKHLPSGRSVRIWDSFSFFQGSFLKACAEWGVEVPPEVTAGKAARGGFTVADLPAIESYNRTELACLVELLGKLRAGMRAAGIELSQWYGAGAAATWLMSSHGAKAANPALPPEVEAAALGAYFGGRIEAGKTGHAEGPIENLDMRSAYPDAMRRLPNLGSGRWERTTAEPKLVPLYDMAVYRVEWDYPHGWPYYPLPWRSKEGAIYFPRVGRGWYWVPEVTAAILTARQYGGTVKLLDGWRFIPTDPNERAFPWVEGLYGKRREVGSKTGAGLAIKLAINALYGKTAQRTGVFKRTPTYRNWAYAGYITSHVRSMLWRMSWDDWDRVIAFATDGIYRYPRILGPWGEDGKAKLGTWERSLYAEGDWVMAGVYRVRKDDGSWELFGRGYGKTGVPWDRVIAGWADGTDKLTVTVSRFHTLGECIHVSRGRPWVDRERWRSWTDEPKEIRLREPSLKRIGAEPFDPQFGVPSDSAPHSPRSNTEGLPAQRTEQALSRETSERTLQRDADQLEAEA